MISSIVFSSKNGEEMGEVTFCRLEKDETDFDDDTNSVVDEDEVGATIEMASSVTLPYPRSAMIRVLRGKGRTKIFKNHVTAEATFKMTFYRDTSASTLPPNRWSVMLEARCECGWCEHDGFDSCKS